MLIKSRPVSNATTVLELLADVKACILEEPKRANMEGFILPKSPTDGGPSCGTVGCFAGWVVMLADEVKQRDRPMAYSKIAGTLLGEDLNYMVPGARLAHVFNAGSGDGIDQLRPGTRRYARAVVRRINGFIQQNREKLQGRLINRNFDGAR